MKLTWTDRASDEDWPVKVTGCGEVAWYDGSTYTFAASITASTANVETITRAAKDGT